MENSQGIIVIAAAVWFTTACALPTLMMVAVMAT
jgi:hypothetical protein